MARSILPSRKRASCCCGLGIKVVVEQRVAFVRDFNGVARAGVWPAWGWYTLSDMLMRFQRLVVEPVPWYSDCSVDSLARAVTWACDGLPGENNLSFFRILSSKFLAHSKKL